MSATTLLVFARAVGFVSRAPGIARTNVPSALRAGFALGLAFALAPSLPAIHLNGILLVAAVCGEALVGALLGVAASLVTEAAAAAGRLLDDLIGIRASIPGANVAPTGLGGLWALVTIVAFFALGGIEAVIAAFARSFTVLPLGAGIGAGELRQFGFAFGASFVRLALDLAFPAIVVALAIHLALAALGRVIPRFGNLTLAFPAAYAGVLLVTFGSLLALLQ
jgi:flagellar biosynthetic protein FliR